MGSLGLTIQFLSIFSEICFSEIVKIFRFGIKMIKHAHQIYQEKLTAKPIQIELSTFLGEKSR